MKKYFPIFLLIIAILAASCATSVSVKVTRPAELDMHGASSISVLPFQTSGAKFNKGKGTLEDVLGLFVEVLTGNDDPQEKKLVNLLTRELNGTFANSEELKLIDSNVVKTALEAGNQPPCDAYLTGQVTDFRYRIKSEEVKRKDDDDNVYYETQYHSKASISIVYQVVDSTTYEIIGYKEVEFSNTSGTYDSSYSCPNAYDLLKNNIRNLAQSISQQVQPYDVNVSLQLLRDKEKNEENLAADKLAKEGLIDESLTKFMNFYKYSGNFVAGYNTALLLQAKGNLFEAEQLMSTLAEKSGDKRAVSALKNIRYEIQQAEKLQSQREAKKE